MRIVVFAFVSRVFIEFLRETGTMKKTEKKTQLTRILLKLNDETPL